jgi:hypothetical protein
VAIYFFYACLPGGDIHFFLCIFIVKFNQIVGIGMSVTDFETDNVYYTNFLLALDLQTLKTLYKSKGHISIVIKPQVVIYIYIYIFVFALKKKSNF